MIRQNVSEYLAMLGCLLDWRKDWLAAGGLATRGEAVSIAASSSAASWHSNQSHSSGNVAPDADKSLCEPPGL
jgi:hypothetical protein